MLWNNDSLKWVFIRMNKVNEWLFSSSCIPETYQQRRSRYIKKTLQISSYIALIGGSKIDYMDIMNSCSWLYLSWKKWNEEINIIFCFLSQKNFFNFKLSFVCYAFIQKRILPKNLTEIHFCIWYEPRYLWYCLFMISTIFR